MCAIAHAWHCQTARNSCQPLFYVTTSIINPFSSVPSPFTALSGLRTVTGMPHSASAALQRHTRLCCCPCFFGTPNLNAVISRLPALAWVTYPYACTACIHMIHMNANWRERMPRRGGGAAGQPVTAAPPAPTGHTLVSAQSPASTQLARACRSAARGSPRP